eukprot:482185-Hanusia_phi.AAC.1
MFGAVETAASSQSPASDLSSRARSAEEVKEGDPACGSAEQGAHVCGVRGKKSAGNGAEADGKEVTGAAAGAGDKRRSADAGLHPVACLAPHPVQSTGWWEETAEDGDVEDELTMSVIPPRLRLACFLILRIKQGAWSSVVTSDCCAGGDLTILCRVVTRLVM